MPNTYQVRVRSVVSNTFTVIAGSALFCWEVVNFAQPDHLQLEGPNTSALVRLGFSHSTSIFLDGSVTDIFDLPVGFNISSVVMHPPIMSSTDAINAHWFLQFDAGTESSADADPFTWPSSPLPTIFDILSFGVGARATVANVIQAVDIKNNTAGFDYPGVRGDYNLLSYTWTVSPSDHIYPATITINSPGANPNLIHTTKIKLTYVDPNTQALASVEVPSANFIIWLTTKITFLLPVEFEFLASTNGFSVLVTGISDGTEFSGEAVIGTFRIFLENGSGIYTLVPGQKHDIVYTDHDIGVTENIKIPDPMIKTGFLP